MVRSRHPGATDWPQDKRDALQGEMITFLLDLTARRRSVPGDDVLTTLAEASIDGDRLNDAELAMFLVQLLVAGNETTRNLLSGGLVALAQDPTQWERLVDDPTLVTSAVEEMLRWTTPVVSFMRTATRPAELSGVAIAAGEPVLMVYASANRDEAVFGPTAGPSTSVAPPTPTSPSASATTSAWGRPWPASKPASSSKSCWPASTPSPLAGAVERSGSSVIAGVRRAELCFSRSPR